MSAQAASDTASELVMRGCIQKVATGPEYSKDLSFEEARSAMRLILDGDAAALDLLNDRFHQAESYQRQAYRATGCGLGLGHSPTG